MISVIIPVYNAEKYIERCIKSVENQLYENWEIIAINDGSTDNSLSILEKMRKINNKIRVYSQENKGAGAARNYGIEHAKGEYIVFLDADDIIDENYFENLSSKKADIVFIDVKRVNTDKHTILSEKMSNLVGMEKDDILRAQMTGKVLWGGVRKAVKRELLITNEIRFSTHMVGEEALYSFLILYFAKNIEFIEKDMYTYYVHEDSLSHSKTDDPWGDVAYSLKSYIKRMGVYEEYADTINAFIITAAVVALDRMAKNYKYNQFVNIARDKVKATRSQIDFQYGIDYKHMDIKSKLMSMFILNNIVEVVFFASRVRNYLKI